MARSHYQNRLYDRFRRVGAKRGYNAAYTAVGRELCGYIWEAPSSSYYALRPRRARACRVRQLPSD